MKTTQKKFTIRQAKTEKDIRAIMDLQVRTWISTYANPEKGVTKSMLRSYFKDKHTPEYFKIRYDALKQKDKNNWVALNNKSAIIGWLGAVKENEEKGDFGLYILPQYQSLGIGTLLMEKGLDWLKTQKIIEIGVLEYNIKAIKFYEKFGFKVMKKRENFKLGDFVGEGWVILMQR